MQGVLKKAIQIEAASIASEAADLATEIPLRNFSRSVRRNACRPGWHVCDLSQATKANLCRSRSRHRSGSRDSLPLLQCVSLCARKLELPRTSDGISTFSQIQSRKSVVWILPSSIRSAFVPELECSTKLSDSAANISDSEPALRCVLSGKVTLHPVSWPGWKRRAWSRPLFGAAISGSSTAARFLAAWTHSLQACPASLTASPERKSETKTSEVGARPGMGRSRTFFASWPKVSPPWCSAKTCLPGFAADGFDLSEKNYAKWVSGSVNQSLSLRKALGRRISVSGYSSWPTVRACSGKRSSRTELLERWPTPEANERSTRGGRKSDNPSSNRGGQANLADSTELWASPSAAAGGSTSRGGDRIDEPLLGGQVKLWMTPRASMANNGSDSGSAKRQEQGENLGLKDQSQAWPTPAARDFKSTGTAAAAARQDAGHSQPLNEAAVNLYSLPTPEPTGDQSPSTSGRRLNPAFVCWLMGWPWFWTRAEPISSDVAAMESSLWRQRLRLSLSQLMPESSLAN